MVSRVYEVCIDDSGSGSERPRIEDLKVRLNLRPYLTLPPRGKEHRHHLTGVVGRGNPIRVTWLAPIASFAFKHPTSGQIYKSERLSLFGVSGTRTDLLGRDAVAQTLSHH